MRVESRIFELLTIFFVVVCVIYAIFATDVVGITALALTAGLSLIIGTYFRFVARRLALRPEDYGDAEVSDGAGDLGFFSPGSYWPIGVAFAAGLTALALAFGQWWLMVVGLVLVVVTAAGLVFEYHLGPEKH